MFVQLISVITELQVAEIFRNKFLYNKEIFGILQNGP